MDDDEVDVLLRSVGDDFRASHTRSARVRTRPARQRAVALPFAAAAATVAAVVAVAFAVPDRQPPPSVAKPQPTPSVTEPQRTPSVAPVQETTVETALPDVSELDLNDKWLLLAGGELGKKSRGRVEVRRRDKPDRITATIITSYPYGGIGCLELDGDQLLWTDTESLVSDYDPGPPTRWSVWQRDLASGAQRRLASGLPTNSTESVPCPAAGQGRAAWTLNGRVTVRDLEAGTAQTFADDATPVAITAAGLVEATWRDRGVQVFLRTGNAFTTRRAVVTVPGGTSLSVGEDRLLVFSVDPGSGSNDAEIVSTCPLPDCAPLVELRRDPGSGPGVVSNTFAAWADGKDAPALVRFDGRPAPALAPGYVPFYTLAAYGDTFGYATQDTDYDTGVKGPATIHLLRMANRS